MRENALSSSVSNPEPCVIIPKIRAFFSLCYAHFKILTHFFLDFGQIDILSHYRHKVASETEFFWHFGHWFCFFRSLNLKNSLHKVIFMAQKWKNIELRGFAHLLIIFEDCLVL